MKISAQSDSISEDLCGWNGESKVCKNQGIVERT